MAKMTKEETTLAIQEIIFDLNHNLGTNYRSTNVKTQSMIKARLNDGFVVADFKKVHKAKIREWKNTKLESFLRPETLYSNKFEGYLNQERVAPRTNTILLSKTEITEKKENEIMKKTWEKIHKMSDEEFSKVKTKADDYLKTEFEITKQTLSYPYCLKTAIITIVRGYALIQKSREHPLTRKNLVGSQSI